MDAAGVLAVTHNLVRCRPQQYVKHLLTWPGNMVLTTASRPAKEAKREGR